MTDDMFDHMGAHEVATVASQAMNMMERLAVPATPDNFSTWFNYAAGSSPSLRKSIDALLGHERKFDASVNRDLYATHIRQGADIGNIPEQLHGVIASARQFLSTAIADNRSQIATLGEVSSQFQVSSDPRPIIEMLVAELSNAAARATSLEARFHETSRELDLIRDSLKIAERRSYSDALTGLANRRSFDEFFRSAQIAAAANGQPLSILMIDIDHFKKFNDKYGHQVGDQVLRLVARVVLDHVREGDLAARYGGEELIAVLPGADLEDSTQVAERIRRHIADARLKRRTTGEVISSVTVSIGVALFHSGESAAATIERCDRALYQAKDAGRNRTVADSHCGDVVAA